MICRLFVVLLLDIIAIVPSAYAQQATGVFSGTSFANSIKPTSAGQIINPSTVNSSAWGSTAIPTTTPTGLGAFSSPVNDSSTYNSAKSLGLTGIGLQTQSSCASYIPGTNALQDQQCAAVNFMSNNCLPKNTTEQSVTNNVPTVSAGSSNCQGTYGQGAAQFNFGNQIASSDPMFSTINAAQSTAASTTASNCTTETVVTTPAQYSTATCITTTSTSQVGCSQSLNTTIATSYAAATTTDTCANGILVGNYCQASSSIPATPTPTCPTGYIFDGPTCTSLSSLPATSSYTCPAGNVLVNGSQCQRATVGMSGLAEWYISAIIPFIAVRMDVGYRHYPAVYLGHVFTPPHPSGYTPVLQPYFNYTCAQIGAAPGSAFGWGSAGGACYVSHTTYSCPTGFTGPTGTPAVCVPPPTVATLTGYTCPGGGTLAGTTCTVTSSTPATTPLVCPPGTTLSGTSCLSSTTTPTTVNYSCADGSAPANGLCTFRSVQTSWADFCTPYEASAGSSLPTP